MRCVHEVRYIEIEYDMHTYHNYCAATCIAQPSGIDVGA